MSEEYAAGIVEYKWSLYFFLYVILCFIYKLQYNWSFFLDVQSITKEIMRDVENRREIRISILRGAFYTLHSKLIWIIHEPLLGEHVNTEVSARHLWSTPRGRPRIFFASRAKWSYTPHPHIEPHPIFERPHGARSCTRRS
jgi:hypothetical protein